MRQLLRARRYLVGVAIACAASVIPAADLAATAAPAAASHRGGGLVV